MNLTFGSLLRRLRKRKGLTLEQMASKLNVSYPAVQQWETNKTIPHRSKLDELSDILGANIVLLYPYDGDSSNEQYTEDLLQYSIEYYEKRKFLEEEGKALGREPKIYAAKAMDKDLHLGHLQSSLDSNRTNNRYSHMRIFRTETSTTSNAFNIPNEVVGLIEKPPTLNHMKYPFGIRIPNASMSPKYDQNELILFDDVSVGSLKGFGLVCRNNKETKLVEDARVIKIVSVDDAVISGLQFNPIEHITINRTSETLIYRALGLQDLIGDVVEKK